MSDDPTHPLKQAARRLRADLQGLGAEVSHAQALEMVAHQLGHRDWSTAVAAAGHGADEEPVVVPVLRVFPGEEAERFYRRWLGFAVDWEHRFEPGLPLYRQVSLGGCVLHLSEHHGDACPGARVRLRVDDVGRLARRLVEDDTYPLRLGVTREEWADELDVPDPFGNHLLFWSPVRPEAGSR
ncbi:glyoxalase superfamily protein [Pseudokineococcus sp. 1T1Z-3]|uniref:glyoxalase superfamily protein n=1 Tax=Pseudokineococcus sp. 1T1Z-3 TaxID=3132745 RepID=UPI0030A18E2D